MIDQPSGARIVVITRRFTRAAKKASAPTGIRVAFKFARPFVVISVRRRIAFHLPAASCASRNICRADSLCLSLRQCHSAGNRRGHGPTSTRIDNFDDRRRPAGPSAGDCCPYLFACAHQARDQASGVSIGRAWRCQNNEGASSTKWCRCLQTKLEVKRRGGNVKAMPGDIGVGRRTSTNNRNALRPARSKPALACGAKCRGNGMAWPAHLLASAFGGDTARTSAASAFACVMGHAGA